MTLQYVIFKHHKFGEYYALYESDVITAYLHGIPFDNCFNLRLANYSSKCYEDVCNVVSEHGVVVPLSYFIKGM